MALGGVVGSINDKVKPRPAVQLYRMATQQPYRLESCADERNLFLISVVAGALSKPSFRTNVNIASNPASALDN
jgi:hypothetical protein